MLNEIHAETRSRVTVPNLLNDWDLLNIEARSRFMIDADGLMLNANYPDLSPAPLMFMAGCDTGNLVCFNREVADATRDAVMTLASDEAPLANQHSTPSHLGRYLELLSEGGPAKAEAGLSFHLPHDVQIDSDVALVFSGTPEGTQLETELASQRVVAKLGLRFIGATLDISRAP